jgi:hypothetical protein
MNVTVLLGLLSGEPSAKLLLPHFEFAGSVVRAVLLA